MRRGSPSGPGATPVGLGVQAGMDSSGLSGLPWRSRVYHRWSPTFLERPVFLNAIDEFTQGVPQTDDITLVVVEKYA